MQPQLLDSNHPSKNTAQAWFQFVVYGDVGEIQEFILVEARNSWAIQTMEKVILDGRASDKCFSVAVFRNCPSAGIRSDILREVQYIDFMLDYADRARLLGDVGTGHAFALSLEDWEKTYAQKKLSAARKALPSPKKALGLRLVPKAEEDTLPEDEEVMEEKPKTSKNGSGDTDMLVKALVGMGYKKPEVREFVQENKQELLELSLADAVRFGITKLS